MVKFAQERLRRDDRRRQAGPRVPPGATWSRSAPTSRSSPPTTGSSARRRCRPASRSAIRDLTVGFRYNDLAVVRALFADAPGPDRLPGPGAGDREPSRRPGFLEGLRELCTADGALLVFDEMITGFRWHLRGAPHVYGVRPDLPTFGKAMGNGFAVVRPRRPARAHGARRVRDPRRAGVPAVDDARRRDARRWRRCSRCSRCTSEAGHRAPAPAGPAARRPACGTRCRASRPRGARAWSWAAPCNLVYGTLDADGQAVAAVPDAVPAGADPPRDRRAVLRRQLRASDEDIDRTVEAVDEALAVYARALVGRHRRLSAWPPGQAGVPPLRLRPKPGAARRRAALPAIAPIRPARAPRGAR